MDAAAPLASYSVPKLSHVNYSLPPSIDFLQAERSGSYWPRSSDGRALVARRSFDVTAPGSFRKVSHTYASVVNDSRKSQSKQLEDLVDQLNRKFGVPAVKEQRPAPIGTPPRTKPGAAIAFLSKEVDRYADAIEQFESAPAWERRFKDYRYLVMEVWNIKLYLDCIEADDESVRNERLVFILSQLSISLFVCGSDCLSMCLPVCWSAPSSRFDSPDHR